MAEDGRNGAEPGKVIDLTVAFQRWQQLEPDLYAVLIDPRTRLGTAALTHFMRRIPSAIRGNFASLRWAGDFWQSGLRWGRIRVTYREGVD